MGYKLFISADIEGVAGITFREECRKGEIGYDQCAQELTREVVTICKTAFECGVSEIVVKDGHGDSSNIDFTKMPKNVTLIRGKSGHPHNMMFGIDESFDGVFYVGYHSPAGSAGSTMSHTSTGNTNYILLNGKRMSEFMLNTYTAAMYNVPVLFLSGDAEICRQAKQMIPDIETAATKSGFCGTAMYNKSLEEVDELLIQGVRNALKGDFSRFRVEMPQSFEYIVNYKDLAKAYKMSYFPGMEKVDDATNKMVSNNYMDIVTAHSFVVY